MSIGVAQPRRAPDRSTATPRIIGGALLGCWIGLMLATVVLGHRDSTFAQLEDDIASGRASDVRAYGGLGPGSTGYSVVQVQWRSGILGYSTEVVEASPRREAVPGRAVSDATRVLVDQRVADRVVELDPDLAVERGGFRNGEPAWDGWTLPGWLSLSTLGILGATLWLVWNGPTPRYATRWGWSWLVVLATPLGAFAYLLTSGAARPGPEPEPDRRVTGGWAFLLALVVEFAFGVTVGALG